MSNSRFGIRWLAWPAIAAIVVFIGLSASTSPVAQANPGSTMSIVPASQIAPLNGAFTIKVHVDTDYYVPGSDPQDGFAGWLDKVSWPAASGIVATSVTENVVAPLSTCGGATIDSPVGSVTDLGCVSTSGPPPPPYPATPFSNDMTTINMTCGNTAGTYALTLEPAASDTDLWDISGGDVPGITKLSATVTCAPASNIKIEAAHSPAPMLVGQAGVITDTVTNLGPAVARGVVAVDVVPTDKVVQGIITCPGAAQCIPLGLGAGQYIGPAAAGFSPAGGIDWAGPGGVGPPDGIPDWPCAYYPAYPNLYPPPNPLTNVVACYIAGAGSVTKHTPMASMAVNQYVHVIIPVVPNATGTVTNIATVPDCPLAAPHTPPPAAVHTGMLLGTTCVWLPAGAVPEPDPTFDNVLLNNTATDDIVEVPPVILEGYDKGASAEPGILWLPAAGLGLTTVSEVIYIVDAGDNPNIVHTWTATPSNDSLTVTWAKNPWNLVAGTPDVYTWTSTGHTDGEEFLATQGLYVQCSGDSGGTVDIDMSMMAGNDPEDSSTSLTVNCMTGQLLKSPGGSTNLWICKGSNCSDVHGAIPGRGSLVINETVSGISGDPLGAGAFEFDVSWDSSIFDVSVAQTTWLGSTGRTVTCTPTIVNENDVHMMCVSSGTGPGPTLGDIIAKITLTPRADLVDQFHLTPGQQNGIVSTVSDFGCEMANTLGDPILGSLQNGRLGGCNSTTVTVRVLEADLNMDCAVNVLDEQAIAYRYGASFGSLLYSPWYDLQPALKDNDIDVKDVQKVFGRDGSTCAAPIPDQPAELPPN